MEGRVIWDEISSLNGPSPIPGTNSGECHLSEMSELPFIQGKVSSSVMGKTRDTFHRIRLEKTKLTQFVDLTTGKRVLECPFCKYQDRGRLGQRMLTHLFSRNRYIKGSCYRRHGLLEEIEKITGEELDAQRTSDETDVETDVESSDEDDCY